MSIYYLPFINAVILWGALFNQNTSSILYTIFILGSTFSFLINVSTIYYLTFKENEIKQNIKFSKPKDKNIILKIFHILLLLSSHFFNIFTLYKYQHYILMILWTFNFLMLGFIMYKTYLIKQLIFKKKDTHEKT